MRQKESERGKVLRWNSFRWFSSPIVKCHEITQKYQFLFSMERIPWEVVIALVILLPISALSYLNHTHNLNWTISIWLEWSVGWSGTVVCTLMHTNHPYRSVCLARWAIGLEYRMHCFRVSETQLMLFCYCCFCCRCFFLSSFFVFFFFF